MASYTPNYNLKKPADSDSYDIADANGNMDIIDGALNTLNSKIETVTVSSSTTIKSLVANGTKRFTATSSSVFTDFPGTNTRYYPIISIYKSGNNAQIDSSCVSGNNEPVFIRGYYENNTLYWYDINSKIASQAGTVTVAQNVTINEMVCQKAGNIVTLNGAVTLTGSFAGKDALLFTLPVGFRPSSLVEFFTYSTYNGTNGMFHFRVKTNGEVVTQVGAGNVTGVVFINLSFCI